MGLQEYRRLLGKALADANYVYKSLKQTGSPYASHLKVVCNLLEIIIKDIPDEQGKDAPGP